jgi:hypothetical protein
MIRGRPFEPGNKMGRGRPKGSRNKIQSEVRQLLERAELPIISKIISQALQGDHDSQRLCVSMFQSLPQKRSCRARMRKMENVEDLLSVAEQTMQQMSEGKISTVEAKATLQGVEQMGQLMEQRTQAQQSQRPPKTPLPEFMRVALEAAQEERLERQAREKKEALEKDVAEPP